MFWYFCPAMQQSSPRHTYTHTTEKEKKKQKNKKPPKQEMQMLETTTSLSRYMNQDQVDDMLVGRCRNGVSAMRRLDK